MKEINVTVQLKLPRFRLRNCRFQTRCLFSVFCMLSRSMLSGQAVGGGGGSGGRVILKDKVIDDRMCSLDMQAFPYLLPISLKHTCQYLPDHFKTHS